MSRDLICTNLPEYIITIIEHPCKIVNIDKGLDTLGGISGINKTLKEKKEPVLKLDQQYLFVSENQSTKVEINGIVIRIRKLRNKRTGQIMHKAQGMGIVKKMYQFKNIMDFVYLPNDNGNSFYDKIMPKNISFMDSDFDNFVKSFDTIYTPPLSFIKNRNEKFNLFHFDRVKEIESKVVIEKKFPKRFEEIIELFKKQPIWSTADIIHELSIRSLNTKLYRRKLNEWVNIFIFGPFHQTYIYKTYDYLKNSESKKFQMFVFHLPKDLLEFFKNYYEKQDENADIPGIMVSQTALSSNILPIKKICFYQRFKIDVPQIEEIFKKHESSIYSPKYGWYDSDVKKELKEGIFEFLKSKMEELKQYIVQE